MRLQVSLIVAAVLGVSACAGSRLGWFPGIQSDPRIRTFIFVDDPRPEISGKSVGVYPFELPPAGEPMSPQFGVFLRHAMLEDRRALTVAYLPAQPWAAVPEWQVAQWSETDRIVAMAREARARGLDYAVTGRVETLFRSTSHAVRARVTVWVVSAADEQVVWYGAKKARWIRALPVDDSLRHLAQSFAIEWHPPKR